MKEANPITITLNKIKYNEPQADLWGEVLEANGGHTANFDDEFMASSILDSNGLDDALWVMTCLPEHNNLWQKFAHWCVDQVKYNLEGETVNQCLELDGNDELSARSATRSATWAASKWVAARVEEDSAARVAVWAAESAAWAAREAAESAIQVTARAAEDSATWLWAAESSAWAAQLASAAARAAERLVDSAAWAEDSATWVEEDSAAWAAEYSEAWAVESAAWASESAAWVARLAAESADSSVASKQISKLRRILDLGHWE